MEIKLSKKPKGPVVIEGFPGFGLVGTIATEFLIDHLKTEQIGRYYFEDVAATIAIHNGKVIDPVSVHYNSKYNVVIIHSISSAAGLEWEAADVVLEICRQLNAKQLISLEGVGSTKPEGERTFYNTTDPTSAKKLEKAGLQLLQEGIIMGVTSAVLLKTTIPTTAIFAETHSELPDSKAAANVVRALDKFLGLKVDYKPLLAQAAKFEEKLKSLLEQSVKAKEEKDKKQLSYIS